MSSCLLAGMMVIVDVSERAGYRIEFLKVMALAFPLVPVRIVIASSYLKLRYF